MTKRIAVIGAGPCGLSQVFALRNDPVELTCFEMQTDWGGLWLNTSETDTDVKKEDLVHTNMYRHLWSNSPKELTESIYYTFDEHFGCPTPSYQPRAVIYDYITGRANRANLRKYIRFQTAVRHVDVDVKGEQLKMTVEDLKMNLVENLIFDYIIIASGRYWWPNIPEFDGISTFPGRVLHSRYFHDAIEFVQQHILIIGSGPSAEDIALQLYKFGASTITISYRTQPTGCNWPDKKIVEVPLLQRMDGRIAYFVDGTMSDREIDTIILCTGYLCNYPFMAKRLRLDYSSKILYPPNLYKGIFLVDHPNIIYLGVQKLLFQFTMFDVQALFVRNVILGEHILPDLQTRDENVKRWQTYEIQIQSNDSLGQFYFRIAYMRDLLAQCYSSPPFDIDRLIAGECEVATHKEKNILTYRDQSLQSIITQKRFHLNTNRLPWLQNMDESIQGFFKSQNTIDK